MIIQLGHESYQVEYIDDPQLLVSMVKIDRPRYFTYDTETTGLHIKADRPFLGAICYTNFVYVFPTNKEMLDAVIECAKYTERVWAHNATYDMHMTANIIGEEKVLSIKHKWADTMGLCRLTFEAVSSRDGGDSLALKKVAKKYLDPNADQYEKLVKHSLKELERERNRFLTAMLKPLGWSYSKLMDAFKKPLEVHIPHEVHDVHEQWLNNCPKPTYQDVPMEIMLPYLATDVILTKMLVERASPVVIRKGQDKILAQEFDLIPVIFKMERVGFALDRDYLESCRIRIEEEIEEIKKQAFELAGKTFKSGQHKLIKQMYEAITDEELEKVDKRFLKGMAKEGDELAPVIVKWRTLEKWHKTYIIKLLRQSEFDGRLYTTLGQFNPVSGRFSGDAQQFPKKALYTVEGDEIVKTGKTPPQSMEIFHPRRAIVVTGGGYDTCYYLDFSQVELRVQAHYTLPFGGDLNLCRAYMPFKCVHAWTGEMFDHKTLEGRSLWNDKQLDKSVWIVPETGEPWKPTDVHSATTVKALKLLGYDPETMSKDDFAVWRSIGKTFNFMRNYGGGAQTAADNLGITLDEGQAMVDGYTEAFPKVIDYQNHVINAMWDRGYVRNLSGRRYYIKNSNRFYKCANYLVQGSCADDLKEKMILIDKFLENYKSRMVMCIHDEIQYEIWVGEEHIIPQIKEIMEYSEILMVPLVSDVEVTSTTWADKKKVVLGA